jgi:acyl carrier protein
MNTEKLQEAFANALQIDKEIVKDELKYQSIPQWDSISHMILVTEIEDAFDVSLSTEDVIDLSSVLKAKEILSRLEINF